MGFRDELASSPFLYPIGLDLKADAVQFIRLTREAYDAAAFLDRRILAPETPTAWAPWHAVSEAAAGLTERCHFIFHISHVGSTLLSRLLGSHPEFFSIREPTILRTFADMQMQLGHIDCPWSAAEFAGRLEVFMRLWSRTFDPHRRSVIKATSFVGEMAEMLLERQPDARAILMYVRPTVFLAALLGGAMVDVDRKAVSRLNRLHHRLNEQLWRVDDLSSGERVAMTWATEMLALRAAAERFADRTLWLDFDRFLAAPGVELAGVFRSLAASESAQLVNQILAGPAMRTYAKATQFEFDACTRAGVLQESKAKHGAEIARGEAWLLGAAKQAPAIAALLNAEF